MSESLSLQPASMPRLESESASLSAAINNSEIKSDTFVTNGNASKCKQHSNRMVEAHFNRYVHGICALWLLV